MKRLLKLMAALLLLTIIMDKAAIRAKAGVNYCWPVNTKYSITCGMYYSSGSLHGATDFGVGVGTPVYAVASGKVITVTDNGCRGSHNSGQTPSCSLGSNCGAVKNTGKSHGSYGNWIVIDHGNNVYSWYCHLQTGSFKVSTGNTVKQGQQIACSGAAGNTYGAHLHFEMRVGSNSYSNRVDPQNYLTKVNVDPAPDPNTFPGPVDSRYSAYLPASAYAIPTGKVTLYDYNGNAYSTSSRYIDGQNDLCEILKVYTNGYCEVKYPSSASSSGYNTLIAKFSDFSPSPNPVAYTADQDYKNAYRRPTGSETIGSVDKNDNCLKLATSGNRTQVIYPTPSSHKIGWIEIPAVAKHAIDLNRNIEGEDYWELAECGTVDIYINGNLDANDVSDYWKEWPEGTRYEVKDIKTKEGYVCKGTKSGSFSGTVGNGEVDLRLIFSIVGKEMSEGTDRRLPDGDYLIVSAADPSYYLDIPGTETAAANGSNVVLTGPLSYYPGAYDIWTLTYNNGFYSICQKNSSASLDVKDGSAERSANVQVWQKNTNSCQKWAINYFDEGKGYRIQSKCSGMSLDIAGGVISNQVNIQQYTGNSSDAQRWLFIPYEPQKTIEDGRYILTTANNRHVELDVPGDTADVSDGANIRIWNDKCPSRFNSFDIKYAGNGYYHFIHAASGKYLEVNGASTDNCGNIQLWTSNGANHQEWCIIPQNGGFMVVNRHSGLVMDVQDGKTEDGTNVRQHYYNGAKAQTWFFEKAEYRVTYDANGGTNAPAEQVKYYNADLTLQETVPERGGYRFLGWADVNADAAAAHYSAGEKYSENKDLKLHAVWEQLEPDMILPASLELIEEEAFEGGTFRYVVLSDGVTSIRKRAFAACHNLKDIYIPETAVTIATDAFDGTTGLTIHGIKGSYAEFYAKKHGYAFVEK